MKKLNKLLLIILIFSLIISSAIYVFGNDNITNNKGKIDNTVDEEVYIRRNNDISNIKLKYKYSFNSHDSKSKIHKYTNENNDEFILNEDQKIVLVYYKQKESNKKSTLNINQLKKIAQEEISNYADIKDYDYETYIYHEQLQNYSFIFTKYINKIKTVDSIQVNINNKGELISTIMPHIGLFDYNDKDKIELSNKYINKKEADELLDTTIKNKFGKLYNFYLKDYSVLEEELYFIKSGELVWKYFIRLEYFNTDRNSDLLLGEYIIIDAISGKIIEMQ
ncbi:UNVERIFIED_CONTAM: hypothetical protein Cloal_2116 [Acetivibrio alkalicellulosi]